MMERRAPKPPGRPHKGRYRFDGPAHDPDPIRMPGLAISDNEASILLAISQGYDSRRMVSEHCAIPDRSSDRGLDKLVGIGAVRVVPCRKSPRGRGAQTIELRLTRLGRRILKLLEDVHSAT